MFAPSSLGIKGLNKGLFKGLNNLFFPREGWERNLRKTEVCEEDRATEAPVDGPLTSDPVLKGASSSPH